MPRILVAAFPPKEDCPDDVSLDLARQAAESNEGNLSVEVLELPRCWSTSFTTLEGKLGQAWDLILLLAGEDIGSIAVERLALNECDGREKDDHGRRPTSKVISETAEPGYWTGLPYRELVIDLSSKGVPTYASHNPGKEIPNFVFFQLMKHLSDGGFHGMAGLVRIPYMSSLRFVSKRRPEAILPLIVRTIFELSEKEDRLAFDIKDLEKKSTLTAKSPVGQE